MKTPHVPILAALLATLTCAQAQETGESFDPGRLEREILVPAARDAIQLEVLADGDVLFVEFWGTVKRWNAKTGSVRTLGKIATHAKGEVGLLGMAAARDFLETGHFFALFCPAEKPDTMRVSRFTAQGAKLAPESELELLSWPYDTEHVYHMGGAMWMDADGLLYIGNGDNCHWNPGLPVDFREGRASWDAYRSAANSRDFRGKILRIRPTADGYEIPDGNLFPGGGDGLAEIFVMGVRNPFRISVDDLTKTLYIGDVGPNVLPELGVTPVGYEEINATREAANFGWPSFIGPNEPLPLFDFDKNAETGRMDPDKPTNPSPNNTGITNLPPAKPALIWYDNLISARFPELGSGGRSVMAGPVYRYDADASSPVKLPRALDGRLFVYEWMRNFILTAKLGTERPDLEPFVPNWNLRRPIDLKIGPDGALYLIEYGDRWWENADSRIVRVVYRRGNRAPRPKIAANLDAGLPAIAGKQPLSVRFDAGESTDPDGDALEFAWSLSGRALGRETTFEHTFRESGAYEVVLTATDPAGASKTAKRSVIVGNARPQLRFAEPAHGSFFDWGEKIAYRVEIRDADSAELTPELASVQGRFQPRRFLGDGEEFVDPGLAKMRQSTCFACHLSDAPSAGPPYEQVALKYAEDEAAAEILAQKVIAGGAGVWGELPMPPHPQHDLNEARQMIAWILSLKDESSRAPRPGAVGTWTAPPKPKEGARADQGVLLLTAGYTDTGADNAPPLRGERTVVLHSRRKKAALYDEANGMEYVEQVEGEKGILGHFKHGDSIVWRELNLTGISGFVVRAGGLGQRPGRVELRAGSAEGELLARVDVPVTGEGEFAEISARIQGSPGLVDVCLVARFEEAEGQVLGVNWVEFREK